jgi:hypothetical protein
MLLIDLVGKERAEETKYRHTVCCSSRGVEHFVAWFLVADRDGWTLTTGSGDRGGCLPTTLSPVPFAANR